MRVRRQTTAFSSSPHHHSSFFSFQFSVSIFLRQLATRRPRIIQYYNMNSNGLIIVKFIIYCIPRRRLLVASVWEFLVLYFNLVTNHSYVYDLSVKNLPALLRVAACRYIFLFSRNNKPQIMLIMVWWFCFDYYINCLSL